METDTLASLIILFLLFMIGLGVFAVVRTMDRREVETSNPPISKSSMHQLLTRVADEESSYPHQQTH